LKTKYKEVGVILEFVIGLGIGIVIAIIASFIMLQKGTRKGYEQRKKIAEAEIGSAEQEAKKIISEAQKASEGKKREVLLEAK
jgi:ribonuclease Y